MVLFIDNETAQDVLDMDSVLQALETGYKELATGDALYRPRIDVYAPCDRPSAYYRWGTMEGVSRKAHVLAIRIKSDITVWNDRTMDKFCGKPGDYCGLVLLFNINSGLPLAIMNDGHIQHMRVGGSAGIGAKYLSRKDSRTVGMIGSGGMARTYAWAFSKVRDLSRIKVYSPSRSHRRAYRKEMSKRLGIDVQDVDDPASAVKGSDIVATCTDSMRPVIRGEWLEEGMHLCNVTQNEIGDDALRRADLKFRLGDPSELDELKKFRTGLIPGMGMSLGAINGAVMSFGVGSPQELEVIPKRNSNPEGAVPTLIDVIAGRTKGRVSDSQITFIHNLGTQGLQFAVVGAKLYDLARKRRVTSIPTRLFLQKIRD